MERRKKLLHRFSKDMLCMEIGPGYNPLLPKRQGWRTLTVDHADRAALVEKYRRFNVDVDSIEEVDIVWAGGALEDRLPAPWLGRVDGCVASHVIEHVPNPVIFFQSLAKILRPGGYLSLAIPDKRYCFDFFQSLTCTGDWLHAWKRGAEIHSQRAVFQHAAYAVAGEDATTWGQGRSLARFAFLSDSLTHAFSRFEAYNERAGNPYEDCHAWHFTPSSFRLLLVELGQLGLIPFSVVETYPSSGCEFFLVLSNTPPAPLKPEELNALRLELLKKLVIEQGVQAHMLTPRPMRSFLQRQAARAIAWLKARLRKHRRGGSAQGG